MVGEIWNSGRFDRSFWGTAETEDDYYGNLNYEAWLVADEVRMYVCVCDDYEWLLCTLLYVSAYIDVCYWLATKYIT